MKNAKEKFNILLCFVIIVFAFALISPPIVTATVYPPGTTLEPDCAPGTFNCGVAVSTFGLGLSSILNEVVNNLITGISGGQTIIGGTAVGDGLIYKSTTGAGTATGIAHQFVGGTNGGTVAATILNNGHVGIGTTSPTSLLHLYKTTDDFTPVLYINSTNADSEITLDGGASPGGGTAAVNLTTGTQTWQMSINGAFDVGNNWNVQDTTAGTVPLTVEKGTGNVGIGTFTPASKLEVNGGIRLNTTNPRPTCDVTTRGTTWFTQGGAGVKDDFEVCAKNAADAYAWRTIF